MAELFVRHSLSSSKIVKFNFTLRQYILSSTDGDHVWVLEVGTTHEDRYGNSIPHVTIYNITELDIDSELEKAISSMCALIDWGTLEYDKEAPIYISIYPEDGTTGVPIKSVIKLVIKDLLPSSGIDLTDLQVTLNNGEYIFDITNEIEVVGDPFMYTLKWTPPNIGDIDG